MVHPYSRKHPLPKWGKSLLISPAGFSQGSFSQALIAVSDCMFVYFMLSEWFFLILFLFYLWLRWVFLAAHGLPLAAASQGYPVGRCRGLSPCWLLCCGERALAAWASAVVEHGLRCPEAPGSFPAQTHYTLRYRQICYH